MSWRRGRRYDPIEVRHERSFGLNSTIIPSNTGWWISSASSSEMYKVEKMGIECGCGERCDECDVCLHEYDCTCPDYMNSNLCKHIHRVVTFAETNAAPVTALSDDEAVVVLSERIKLESEKNAVARIFTSMLASVENLEQLEVIRRVILAQSSP